MAIGFLGVDSLKKVNRLAFFVFTITMLLFIAAYGIIAQGNYQQSFDSSMRAYNLTYSQVVSSISTNSAFVGFNLASTLIAFPLLGFLTYSGFNFNTYTAGETKDVSNTIPKSLLYAVLVSLTALVILSSLSYSVLGSLFVGGISYLYNTGGLAALPVQPTINFLLSLAIPPWLGVLINLNVGVGFFLVGLNTLVMFSRIIFAMGFDRVVPLKCGEVNDKFGSPHIAIIIVGIVAMIFETLYWFAGPGLLSGYLNTSIAVDVAYIIPGLGALLLPLLRRDLYQRLIKPLPGWLGKEIAGVPLISIGGLGVVLIWGFGVYSMLVPVSSYSYLGSSIPLAAVYTVGPTIAGLAIYEVSRAYHKRKDNLDIALVFKEIPPE
jgi:amino acid transporter